MHENVSTWTMNHLPQVRCPLQANRYICEVYPPDLALTFGRGLVNRPSQLSDGLSFNKSANWDGEFPSNLINQVAEEGIEVEKRNSLPWILLQEQTKEEDFHLVFWYWSPSKRLIPYFVDGRVCFPLSLFPEKTICLFPVDHLMFLNKQIIGLCSDWPIFIYL